MYQARTATTSGTHAGECSRAVAVGASAGLAGTDVVVTPAALEYYQESFRQLAFECSDCWFYCCKAEDLFRAEHLERTKRNIMVENGGRLY